MDGRSLLIAALTLLTATVSAACQTPDKRAGKKDTATETTQTAKLKLDHDRLVLLAETLRDREFPAPPNFEAADDSELSTVLALPDEVRADRDAILRGLFGMPPRDWKPGEHPYRSIARWDAGTKSIFYVADHADRPELERAVLFALVQALDEAHFGDLPTPSTWDEALAIQAVRDSTGAFVVALQEAREHADQPDLPPFTAETLAKRPELATKLQGVGPKLTVAPGSAGDRARLLSKRTDAFALREGLGLTAAMYRSGGWSAVEMTRQQPPTATPHVVRPDEWLAGESLGSWKWPKEVEEARSKSGWEGHQNGRVGPALAAIWLSQHVDPRIARTLYLAFESDAFRFYRKPDGGPDEWAFEWLSLWNTPHTAQQVVEALDGGLRNQPGGGHYSVLRRGATIAVIGLSRKPGEEDLDLGTRLVEVTPRFEPGEPRLVTFSPTPADELQRKAALATLDEKKWQDPATQLTASTEPLAKWKLQKTDEAHLRWFARHEDDSIIEFTTELVDPFAPSFGTNAYEKRVVEAFRATVKNVESIEAKRRDHAVGPMLVLDVRGEVSEVPTQLRVWQFRTGNHLVSFSLQASPERFERHLQAAKSVIETMRGGQTSDGPGERSPGGGIREFEVEE